MVAGNVYASVTVSCLCVEAVWMVRCCVVLNEAGYAELMCLEEPTSAFRLTE